jgi:hypothetical protein
MGKVHSALVPSKISIANIIRNLSSGIFYFKKHAMTFLLYGKTSFENHEKSY